MEKGKRTMNPDNKKRKIDSEVGASTLAEEEEQVPVPDYKLDDIMYKEVKYFSQSAIHSLKNLLLGEEEENFKRKSVFLWVLLPYSSGGRYDFKDGWLKIHVEEEEDYHKTLIPSVSIVDESMKDQENAEFPPELLDLKNYGCAARNSQIIIAGGLFQPDDDVCNVVLSDRVYTYDTVSKKWGRLPNMVSERPATPTVVVADNKIFVIDGNPQHDSIYSPYTEDREEQDEMKIPLWAEYYDFAENSKTPPKWDKFFILPPTYLARYPPLSYYAVYPKGSLVLFYIKRSWVVSFNYSTWAWNVYKPDEPIAQCPRWSDSVVVLDHFLFCHHYETIYGHDLSNGTTHPVYTFDDTSTHFGPVYDFKSFYYSPPLTFLIHLGNNELCLLWLEKNNTIRYFMFRVQIFMGAVEPATLHLVLSSTGLLEAPAAEIGLALEVSSSV